MSNIGEIKEEILKILEDGKIHSIKEMKSFMLAENPQLDLENGNVSTAMYQLRKKDLRIIKIGKSSYQLVEDAESDMWCEKKLNDLEFLCNSLIKECDGISLMDNLSYKEYRQRQLCYKMNKKILEIIRKTRADLENV